MEDLTISPHYDSARDELTQPDSFRSITNYFREKWMRDLGPTGTAILIALRARCYHNRKTDELRDETRVTMAEIAAEIGTEEKTVRRHLAGNAALRVFVTAQQELAFDARRKGFRNSEKSFKVLMTDPIHPSDEEAMMQIIRRREEEREKGSRSAQERAKERAAAVPATSGQNVRTQPATSGHFDRTQDKMSLCPDNMSGAMDKMSGHIDESPDSSIPEITLTSSQGESILSPSKIQQIPPWSTLADSERELWRERAKERLGPDVLAKPDRGGIITRAIDHSARTLYEKAMKG